MNHYILVINMQITKDILEKSLGKKIGLELSVNGKISIDSRTIKSGDIFITINNGHQYINKAITNGASLVITDHVSNDITDEKILLVNSSIDALKSIGNFIKLNTNLKKTIGITGSVGKTTTKSWLSIILNKKFNTFSSIKNYNTIYGLPICLSLLEQNIDFGIFELGSNHPGEILELTKYLEPDIGVITNIYESHIGHFENKKQLANEKISIINGIKKNGMLIFDGDSEFRKSIIEKAISKNISYYSVGFTSGCDFFIQYLESNRIRLRIPTGIEYQYNIHVFGKHYHYISACVLAIIYSIGLNIEDFIDYIRKLFPIEGRGEIKTYKYHNKNLTIIDDTYNASPTSMKAAIDTLIYHRYKKKVLIIGQMNELGNMECYYHTKLVEYIHSLQNTFSKIFFIGDNKLWKIIKAYENIICYDTLNDFIIENILEMIDSNSIILLKGSRSIELDKIISYIKCSIT